MNKAYLEKIMNKSNRELRVESGEMDTPHFEDSTPHFEESVMKKANNNYVKYHEFELTKI